MGLVNLAAILVLNVKVKFNLKNTQTKIKAGQSTSDGLYHRKNIVEDSM
jgi:hypothetical protein